MFGYIPPDEGPQASGDIVLHIHGREIRIPKHLDPVTQFLQWDDDEASSEAQDAVTALEFDYEAPTPPGKVVGNGQVAPEVAAKVAGRKAKKPSKTNKVAEVAGLPAERPIDHTETAMSDQLDCISETIKQYVSIKHYEAQALSLIVLATHAFSVSTIFPRVLVWSEYIGSGKSTLLKVLKFLVPNPKFYTKATEASIVRVAEREKGLLCLLLDEGDRYFDDFIVSIFNSGYDRDGALMLRCIPKGKGYEDHEFNTYFPLFLAKLGPMKTLSSKSRSISIQMFKAKGSEHLLRLNKEGKEELEMLNLSMAAWAADQENLDYLSAYDPSIPSDLINRNADVWRFLIAVGDRVGGHWRQSARDIAKTFVLGNVDPILRDYILDVSEGRISLPDRGHVQPL